jgi:tRNA 2-selenouridine synthase
MRSASVAWLLGTVGVPVVVLEGGYKAYRAWCSSAALAAPARLLLLSGLTGSGKTEVLAALAAAGEAVVDIEALTCHRGSSFGSVASGDAQTELADEHGLRTQPPPEQFENDLAAALVAAAERAGPAGRVWLEDEAQNLGRCFIPQALYARMRAAPLLLMAVSTEERVSQLQADYASASADALCAAAERLRKPLGGAVCDEVQTLIRSGNTATAARILLTYYDASYAHALSMKGKVALRLSFKPGASAAQCAAALAAAASALDEEVYAACEAVGAAEEDARARKLAERRAAKAVRRAKEGKASPAPGAGGVGVVMAAAPPRGQSDVLHLLSRRRQAFEAAVVRAGAAVGAVPPCAALLEREVELCLPPGPPRDLASEH